METNKIDLNKINLSETEAKEVLDYYSDEIEEKIFEDLFRLKSGFYLKWNRLYRRWVQTGPIYWDIFN